MHGEFHASNLPLGQRQFCHCHRATGSEHALFLTMTSVRACTPTMDTTRFKDSLLLFGPFSKGATRASSGAPGPQSLCYQLPAGDKENALVVSPLISLMGPGLARTTQRCQLGIRHCRLPRVSAIRRIRRAARSQRRHRRLRHPGIPERVVLLPGPRRRQLARTGKLVLSLWMKHTVSLSGDTTFAATTAISAGFGTLHAEQAFPCSRSRPQPRTACEPTLRSLCTCTLPQRM